MAHLIDKSALVAEINKRIIDAPVNNIGHQRVWAYNDVKEIIDTLEVREVDEKFECPTIKVKDDVSVSSRMQYIDDELKPIAEFIMEYASWNLHKEERNHPVLEVPLFRVLDALIQRGKPYCEG